MTQEYPIHHASFTMSAPDTPRRRIRIAEHLRRMVLAIEAGAKFHGGLYASGEYSLSGDVVLTEVPETVASAASYLVDHPWVRGLLRAEEVLAYIGDPTVHDSDPGCYEARAKIGLDAVREALMTPVSNPSQPAEQPSGEQAPLVIHVDREPFEVVRDIIALPEPQRAEKVPVEQHPDDAAVDAFAAALKAKLAEARAKGRAGWNNDEPGMQERLSNMLREHVEKGDPRDVANFAMFLHQRGESILPKPEQAVGDGVASCDWPAGKSFTVLDDPDEHKPCYLVMPDGSALPLCHHAKNGVDQARAKFIADACNAALRASRPVPVKVDYGVTVWMIRSNTGVVHWDETGCVFPDEESAQREARLMTDSDPDGQSFGAFPLSYVPRPATVEVGDGVDYLHALDQADVALGIAGLADDDIFRVELQRARAYFAELLTPRPAVAPPAEVTDALASSVLSLYRAEVGTAGPMDLMPIDAEAMRVALAAALTAQCQVRKDGKAMNAFALIPEPVEAPTPELWRAYETFNDVYKGYNTQQALRAAINGVLSERAALASPSAGAVVPDRNLLRAVVDKAWQEATESEQVPATEWADRIIDQVIAAMPEVSHR